MSDNREAIVPLPRATFPCGHDRHGPTFGEDMVEMRLCQMEWSGWVGHEAGKRLLAIARAALRIGPDPVCETHDPDCGCCSCEMRNALRGVVA